MATCVHAMNYKMSKSDCTFENTACFFQMNDSSVLTQAWTMRTRVRTHFWISATKFEWLDISVRIRKNQEWGKNLGSPESGPVAFSEAMWALHLGGPIFGHPQAQDGSFPNDFQSDNGKNKGKIWDRINSDRLKNISWTHEKETDKNLACRDLDEWGQMRRTHITVIWAN